MRRISVNIILILVLILAAGAVILPALAKIYSTVGQSQEKLYRWKSAKQKFAAAMRLDPLNAEYYAMSGAAFSKRANILKHRMPSLLSAEDEYRTAAGINPFNYQYWMNLAEIELKLFSADNVRYRNRLARAISYLKEAYATDANNYVLEYQIGCALLSVWSHIDGDAKQFALKCLRQCLEITPWYHWQVFRKVWDATKDFEVMIAVAPERLLFYRTLYEYVRKEGQWEYRRRIAAMIDTLSKNEEADEWQRKQVETQARIARMKKEYPKGKWIGSSGKGGYAYTDGKMYWEGTVDRVIDLPAGTSGIFIQAYGTQANEIYPYMVVTLDGAEIGGTYVDGRQGKEYRFAVADNGIRVLSVTFVNDGGNRKRGEDRNLFLGAVRAERNAHE